LGGARLWSDGACDYFEENVDEVRLFAGLGWQIENLTGSGEGEGGVSLAEFVVDALDVVGGGMCDAAAE
jgi:hypothetical protein